MQIFFRKKVILVREKFFRPLQTRRQVSATAMMHHALHVLDAPGKMIDKFSKYAQNPRRKMSFVPPPGSLACLDKTHFKDVSVVHDLE